MIMIYLSKHELVSVVHLQLFHILSLLILQEALKDFYNHILSVQVTKTSHLTSYQNYQL
jgi:hypothetical protein